ncbi:thioesterase thiol ester dehydrase-isomerase [Neolentinus lepideus HHB14362 ss-1]|uniref:Thioesterase thiol ester dehydrase-isomerase n=1 Tax=Neolentinus lepideus HHB14362 ss-1 TaxID=1314782 RepID=A0A165MX09_9AGAM|nr:thioesterase thiol ester dehydrase-isomerase [Neolentinus lepideus HHB14362 ss-1]
MSDPALKYRTRSDYAFFQTYRTRWSDNDQYAHLNNAIYYHLFDSITNAYLIAHCSLSPTQSRRIGLVVSSHCSYFRPLSYPTVLELGLRVNKLGRSSVEYEVAVFEEGEEGPAAVGGYTHVFVDSEIRKTAGLDEETRKGLMKLLRTPSASPSVQSKL